jgi:hypothetical protein
LTWRVISSASSGAGGVPVLALLSARSNRDLAVAHHDQYAAMAALGADAMGKLLLSRCARGAPPSRRAAG